MKRIFLCSLALGTLSSPLLAQPQENDKVPPSQIEVPRAAPIPTRLGEPKDYLENDVKAFIETLNSYKVWHGEKNPYVLNAKTGFFGMNEWVKWWRNQVNGPENYLKLTNTKTQNITPQNVATVAVSFKTGEYDQAEILRLQWNQQLKRWQVEPQKPGEYEYLSNAPLRWAAYMCAQEKGSLDNFYSTLSAENLKQCALGVLQFAQDFDQELAFAPQFWREAIFPYTRNEKIYLQPDNKQPYTFNYFLSGKTLGAIPTPENTVLFYEGENEKLNFRENGISTVCFMDGHISQVNAEQAKTLIWKL